MHYEHTVFETWLQESLHSSWADIL